ncbi:glycosyltransferase [bacterium]|nr:glycosyltransferase [bacterium]
MCDLKDRLGLVAIARNEGQRLHQCLLSALKQVDRVVYVDSGSTDSSVELARSLGVDVVELDMSLPFTAARARNAGCHRLLEIYPDVEFVQFVDGDCEVVEGWCDRALQELEANPKMAVVCGRRRERFPEASIYNQLCDMEWDTPVGEAKYCGGDALMRVAAFQQVDGFNPTLIAGEEPELCVRLRQNGWRIYRIEADMTLHDAQMMHFSQWWKRSLRAGHAYAEGAWLHGRSPERHWVRESRSIWLWGLGIPLVVLGTAWVTWGLSILFLLNYPLLFARIYYRKQQQGLTSQNAALYAVFCVLGKFSMFQGQLQFHWNRLLGKRTRLVEYKNLTPTEVEHRVTS